MNNFVEETKNEFILDHGKYHIAKDTCDSPEKILFWIRRLCQYNWINIDTIYEFVDLTISNIKLKQE